MIDSTPTPTSAPVVVGSYSDSDLVYVDPETRTVVGRVEFTKADKPKSLAVVAKVVEEPVAAKDAVKDGKKRPRRAFFRAYYPWGTYRSMKHVYKIDGKVKEPEPNLTLEEVLPKALEQVFW